MNIAKKEVEKVDDSNLFVIASKNLLCLISTSIKLCDPTDRQGIRWLASSLKDMKDVGNHQTELDRREQLARINKLEREAREEQVDKTITIKFEDEELEGYGD